MFVFAVAVAGHPGHGRDRGCVGGRQGANNQVQADADWIWTSENETDADPVPFLENSGLKVRMNSQTPLDFLQLYWTD